MASRILVTNFQLGSPKKLWSNIVNLKYLRRLVGLNAVGLVFLIYFMRRYKLSLLHYMYFYENSIMFFEIFGFRQLQNFNYYGERTVYAAGYWKWKRWLFRGKRRRWTLRNFALNWGWFTAYFRHLYHLHYSLKKLGLTFRSNIVFPLFRGRRRRPRRRQERRRRLFRRFYLPLSYYKKRRYIRRFRTFSRYWRYLRRVLNKNLRFIERRVRRGVKVVARMRVRTNTLVLINKSATAVSLSVKRSRLLKLIRQKRKKLFLSQKIKLRRWRLRKRLLRQYKLLGGRFSNIYAKEFRPTRRSKRLQRVKWRSQWKRLYLSKIYRYKQKHFYKYRLKSSRRGLHPVRKDQLRMLRLNRKRYFYLRRLFPIQLSWGRFFKKRLNLLYYKSVARVVFLNLYRGGQSYQKVLHSTLKLLFTVLKIKCIVSTYFKELPRLDATTITLNFPKSRRFWPIQFFGHQRLCLKRDLIGPLFLQLLSNRFIKPVRFISSDLLNYYSRICYRFFRLTNKRRLMRHATGRGYLLRRQLQLVMSLRLSLIFHRLCMVTLYDAYFTLRRSWGVFWVKYRRWCLAHIFLPQRFLHFVEYLAYTFLFAMKFKNYIFFVKYLAFLFLKFWKKQYQTIKLYKKMLRNAFLGFKTIQGIFFRIRGKMNRRPRARTIQVFRRGKPPLQNFHARIYFAGVRAQTKFGMYSFRFWIYGV